MDLKKKVEDLFRKLSSNMYNFFIVFLIGVLLIVVTNFFSGNDKSSMLATKDTDQGTQTFSIDTSNYELNKNTELKNMLSVMQGVGRVNLMINFESGEELVPAINLNDVSSTAKENDGQGGVRITEQTNKGSQVVITNKGSGTEPLILKKYYPKITGVMIIAEGAYDKGVQLNVKNAVASLFNISTTKVYVYPMQK